MRDEGGRSGGFWLEDRIALVTGGSAGIGREIAAQLARAGATVLIVARDRGRASAAAAAIDGDVHGLAADLASPADRAELIAKVQGDWPALSILVNNAGVQVCLPATGIGDDGRAEALHREIELNLAAPVALSLGLMPLLARQPQAAIVNISSGLALAPKRSAPVYCATKAGLSSFSTALRYRCDDAAPGVRVIDVIMDLVDTGMTAGRGGSKMTAANAAASVVRGLKQGKPVIWVGRTRLLRLLTLFCPPLARRLMRNA